MTDKVVVLVTAGSAEECGKIAHSLVEKRLAACVNLVPGVESHYWWEGKLSREGEILMVLKKLFPIG